MLRLTKKLEYGLIALRHMQMHSNTLIKTKEISDTYLIPNEILAKTLQKMVKLKYIKSSQGSKGGYQIYKNLKNISLAQFIEEMEGPIGMVDCNINSLCDQLDNCNIRIPFEHINNNFRKIFNEIYLADITL